MTNIHPFKILILFLVNLAKFKYEVSCCHRVDEDCMYVMSVPSLPGCISQGKTRGEALRNIKDAIKSYLESFKKT